ncbi:MAG: ABC transporter ATP-binding protein [Flavobacteriales bacterium]|jgi:iron complex transport system ATP-binding protein|nr:ABC transporter ATP-binding protein [Flavobacteriales bacterium]
MDSQLLKINELAVGYTSTIISKINAVVKAGDFITLFGANGAGKSTLLKTILQQLPPKSGQLLLNQKNITEYSNTALAKNIAIVNTNKNFDLNLTVYDILALGRIPYLNLFGKLTQQDQEIIEKYIQELALNAIVDNYFYQLSDGQKQKVLVARALIQDTDLIILDEPTAHLDIKNRITIFQLLQNIAHKKQKAIICVSHEIDIALKYASKVWLIDKHHNFITDTPDKFNTDTIYCNLF